MTYFLRSLPLKAALTVLALGAGIAGCSRDQAAASNRGKDASNAPVVVTTTVVAPKTFADSIVAIGTAHARDSITVTAKVSEIVQAVHFDSGDEVAKGQVLVTLSGQQQQAALVQAEAASNEAQQMYKRQEELARQQLIASSQLDTQRATRDQAMAQVNQVRAQLADRSIRAPFGGVMGIRQISPGTLITPGTAIATLDDLSHMYVDFPVPEGMLAQLANGQHVAGRTAAYPDKRLVGTVATVDARVDPATRSVTVRADFPNPDHKLRPGMLVNVELQQAQRTALLLPEIAVVQVGDRTFVYRVKPDGSVEQIDVQIGTRTDGQAEILKGVNAGDRIVVDGTGKLRPGQKIADAGKPSADQDASPAPVAKD